MDFSKFFIERPIFAIVLSIIIFAVGLIAIPILPVSEYPEVVPPSVVVRATYPGANPKEIADSVAEPLEEAINGVEGIMYMKSVAGSDGSLQVVVTFLPGTQADAKVGAKVFIGATKAADGSLSAARINVGKDGLTPPM